MAKKLYVGNLTFGATDSDLQTLFGAHGTVRSAQVIMDRDTGRSKGFGFVEMQDDQEAQAAIAALNGQDVNGRADGQRARPEEGGDGSSGGGPRASAAKRYWEFRPRIANRLLLSPQFSASQSLMQASRSDGREASAISHKPI